MKYFPPYQYNNMLHYWTFDTYELLQRRYFFYAINLWTCQWWFNSFPMLLSRHTCGWLAVYLCKVTLNCCLSLMQTLKTIVFELLDTSLHSTFTYWWDCTSSIRNMRVHSRYFLHNCCQVLKLSVHNYASYLNLKDCLQIELTTKSCMSRFGEISDRFVWARFN